ncbi:MAG: RhuM family protein [Paludibacteraceae bacterium]|nr:RhuM family protein [Bacteroidales bacterium]MEE1177141.1 RhuM family protein [Paludibacteraceae bacterium]
MDSNKTESCKGEIILYQPNESLRLEVQIENDTVWLTQQQMAELFLTTKQNVSLHINNIFKEQELSQHSVVKDFLTTASDGKKYKTKYYNLDVIISVGYRVKSQRGTQFRIWANKILKDYLLRGYSVNRQLVELQGYTDNRFLQIEKRLDEHQQQIDFFVRTNIPPHEGCVFEGHLLEGREVAEMIIKSAKHEVILIDPYIGSDTLHILEARQKNVSATIYTEKVNNNILTLQHNHETEYGKCRRINIFQYKTNFHDRFLIIDETVYHFGASIKDLGKRLFAFDVIHLSKNLIMGEVV